MNFAFESIKLKTKAQNEDFYFELETPRGHFFAVLDFAPHDYANLNATLKSKFETIVASFVSLSRFSADLFLGFLAKEINNFLHNLGQQSGGPELLCSAALCLVSGNRLSYFLCGDTRISILGGVSPLPLPGTEFVTSALPGEKAAAAEQANKHLRHLGASALEAPMTDRVQAFTLQDDDVVLIATHGLEGAFENEQLADEVMSNRSSDPKLICDALIKASTTSGDDRTVLVISGPYEPYVDPVLVDLSKAAASLEARLDSFSSDSQLEQRIGQQLEELKDDLRAKATKIDLLELDEKVKNLSLVLAGKADAAEVLSLQSDVLKLGRRKKRASGRGKTANRSLSKKVKNLSLVLAGKADAAEVLNLQSDVLKLGRRKKRASGRGKTANRSLSKKGGKKIDKTGSRKGTRKASKK